MHLAIAVCLLIFLVIEGVKLLKEKQVFIGVTYFDHYILAATINSG